MGNDDNNNTIAVNTLRRLFDGTGTTSRGDSVPDRPQKGLSRFNRLKRDYDKEIVEHQKLVKKYNELLDEYKRHLDPYEDHKCRRRKCICMCHLHDTFKEITW